MTVFGDLPHNIMATHLNLHREQFDQFPNLHPADEPGPPADLPLAGTVDDYFPENPRPKQPVTAATRREITNRLLYVYDHEVRHLKKLAADKEESLGMLIHDLKNHLVGLNMSADVLCDGNGPPNDPYRRLMLENISRSSSQMLSFVNEFLAGAATNRRLEIKLGPVNFSEAASRSVRQFQEAARRKELVVNTSLPDEATMVQADPNALSRVLDNLVSNAVKFSPSGKQISVLVRPSASYVECQVQDQGNGFTPDDKEKMFRRYEKLSSHPTGGETSAGLGLSIVKKLVEAMRGEVACESTAGSGARFTVRLPRAVPQYQKI
jgi:two-component system sensor histidine kinase/response regulator